MNWSKVLLIIVSIIIALLLWFHVVTERTYTYTYTFPVLTTGTLPKEYVIANELPESLRVVLRGKGKYLLNQIFNPGKIFIDLSKLSYGEKRYIITKDDLLLVSSRLQLVRVEPTNELRIFVDRISTRQVPIRSRLTIIPEPGFTVVGDPEFSPESVIVYGPERDIKAIKEVYTLPETLGGYNISTTVRVPLQRFAAQIKLNVDTVIAKINIEPLAQKTLSKVYVNIVGGPPKSGYTIPRFITVKLSGAKGSIENLRKSRVQAIVDYQSALKSKSGKVAPIIITPPGVQAVATIPESVKVVITKRITPEGK